MDDMRYVAVLRRMEALEARVAALEKDIEEQTDSVAAEKLRDKYPVHMNKTEAAKELGVTRATIYAMISDGRLKENVLGKVTTDSMIKLVLGPKGKKYGVCVEESIRISADDQQQK